MLIQDCILFGRLLYVEESLTAGLFGLGLLVGPRALLASFRGTPSRCRIDLHSPVSSVLRSRLSLFSSLFFSSLLFSSLFFSSLLFSLSGDVSTEGDLFLLISDSFGAIWILALKPLVRLPLFKHFPQSVTRGADAFFAWCAAQYKHYHPLVVAAYNYTIGAVGMIITALVLRHRQSYW